jgi:mannose-1-phosphate guanylyltransferase
LVKKEEHFRKILKTAGEFIKKQPQKIVFVAQKPRFASQNLGWIDFGSLQFENNDIDFHSFFGFKYKPSAEVANDYLQSGHHGWNLGYFVTTPAFLWDQYKKFAPNLHKSLEEIVESYSTPKFLPVLDKIYPTLEKVHFDNAILEKLDLKDAYVVCENIEWSDIGAWEALKEALESSEQENVTRGNVLIEDTKDSLVFNFTKQLVVGIDLEEMVVVNTGDVVLICPKSSVAKIKKIVQSLEGTPREHLA